jgi:cytochrome c553
MHPTSARSALTARRVVFGIGLLLSTGAALAAPAGGTGSVAAGKAKSAACAACHGADGNGVGNPDWPKLAGQAPEYLAKQLRDFKSGARKDLIMNGTMNGMAAGLSEQDIRDIAAYYASQPLKPGVARDAELVKLGERIYRGGIAERRVPACMSCHGPSGHGIPPKFPRLSGQNAGYTEKQMLFFKAGTRRNDDGVMTPIAFELSEREIKAIADYTAGLR